MRILIASSGTIAGYSGGWTTTLDLLGDRHDSMYFITSEKPGLHTMEGIKYLGLGLGIDQEKDPILPPRLILLLRSALIPVSIKFAFRKFNADFVLCLDEAAGFSVQKLGLPYAMRFHTKVNPSVIGSPLETLLQGAIFATACQGSDVPGVEVFPHNQDLSRFKFAPPAKPEKALLLTTMNAEHEIELFIEGICSSESMKGDIIGTGPDRKKIESICRNTDGRIRVLDPVPRLKVGQLSGQYQIGVATIVRRDKVVYSMNAYSGKTLYPYC